MPRWDPGDDGDPGLTFTASTAELANKRITVSYSPSSDDDAAIIDAYHGLFRTPSYAATLVPVLRVDGQVVARGSEPIPVGYVQNFRLTYRSPGTAADTVENPIVVGALEAVSLDLGSKEQAEVDARAAKLQGLASSTRVENVLTDARAGEMLALAGDIYFMANDRANEALSRAAGVDARRSLSGAVVGTELKTALVAGFPISVDLGGANVDVDEDVQAVVPLTDSGRDLATDYLRMSGANASFSESQTLRFLFINKTVSTGEVLAKAAGEQIPIFGIDQENWSRVEPQLSLSASVKTQIHQAVIGGATVTAPGAPVSIGGWRGAGYIITQGGSQDYRITGGGSGGTFATSPALLVEWPDDIPAPPGNPVDWKDWAVWVAALVNLNERINLGCIGGALTIAGGVLAAGEVSAAFAGLALGAGVAAMGTPLLPLAAAAALGTIVAEVVFHALWAYFLYVLFNSLGSCLFTGLWPDRDG